MDDSDYVVKDLKAFVCMPIDSTADFMFWIYLVNMVGAEKSANNRNGLNSVLCINLLIFFGGGPQPNCRRSNFANRGRRQIGMLTQR